MVSDLNNADIMLWIVCRALGVKFHANIVKSANL